MATKQPGLFEALDAPFDPRELKTRAAGGDRRLTYITARTAMNRLDEVLGPENWSLALAPWGEDALIGTLTVTFPDGTQVAKSAVGGRAGMACDDDDAKSADSDTLKRCAVLFGVGRYLYRDGTPNYRRTAAAASGPASQPVAEPPRQRRAPPEPDQQAPPAPGPRQRARTRAAAVAPDPPAPEPPTPAPAPTPAPKPKPPAEPEHDLDPRFGGRELYAWARGTYRNGGPRLLDRLVWFGRQHGYPTRVVDWSSTQAHAGRADCNGWLLSQAHGSYNGKSNGDGQ